MVNKKKLDYSPLVTDIIKFANHITPDKKKLNIFTKKTAKKHKVSELGVTELLMTVYKTRLGIDKSKKR